MSITNGRPHYKWDYHEELAGYLTSSLQGATIHAIVRIIAEGFQATENDAQGIISQRLLDEAVGVHLDALGRLVGEPRGGLLDEDYRRFIAARILTNMSAGEAPRLIRILSLLTRATRVFYQPIYPAGMAFDYTIENPLPDTVRTRIKEQMQEEAPAAGVAVHYITEAPLAAFGFADDDDALGFDEGGFAETI